MSDGLIFAAAGKLVCLLAFVALVAPWVYQRLKSPEPQDWRGEGNTKGDR